MRHAIHDGDLLEHPLVLLGVGSSWARRDDESECCDVVAHFGGGGVGIGESHRMSVGGAPSDLGQSLMPYLSVEMKAIETQCDIWGVAEMREKEESVNRLAEQLE